MERNTTRPLTCSTCGEGDALTLGTVRVAGRRDGSEQGAGIELTVNERLVVNGRDLDAAAAVLRSVSAQVWCTRCSRSMDVQLVERNGAVELSLGSALG